jgi:hypothetical protein
LIRKNPNYLRKLLSEFLLKKVEVLIFNKLISVAAVRYEEEGIAFKKNQKLQLDNNKALK